MDVQGVSSLRPHNGMIGGKEEKRKLIGIDQWLIYDYFIFLAMEFQAMLYEGLASHDVF